MLSTRYTHNARRRVLMVTGLVALLCLGPGGLRAADEYVLAGPPRESREKAVEVYQPIADYLTRVTGKTFVYHYSNNWLTYQMEMRKGMYDLVFDGPAFVGWRMAMLSHVPLVKVPGNLSFVVIARKDNDRIKNLKDLAGHTICGFAPPNLSTLTILNEFDNPAREPALVQVLGFRTAYDQVVSGTCQGGVLQARLYEDYDKDRHAVKVLFRSKPMPNQAFSAGPRIDAAMRGKIIEALLSEDGRKATKKMRDEFKGQDFVPADPQEYEGLGKLLRDVWGFDMDTPVAKTGARN